MNFTVQVFKKKKKSLVFPLKIEAALHHHPLQLERNGASPARVPAHQSCLQPGLYCGPRAMCRDHRHQHGSLRISPVCSQACTADPGLCAGTTVTSTGPCTSVLSAARPVLRTQGYVQGPPSPARVAAHQPFLQPGLYCGPRAMCRDHRHQHGSLRISPFCSQACTADPGLCAGTNRSVMLIQTQCFMLVLSL